MILKIASRNIWRNKRRSLIVLGSIIVGVIALILNNSIGEGVTNQMLQNRIENFVTHIQIHDSSFNDNRLVTKYISNIDKVSSALDSLEFVENYAKRLVVFGLITSASNSSGLLIIGADPQSEKLISSIDDKIIAGNYIDNKRNSILISKKTSEKLEVDVGDKIVAIANSEDGSVTSELFRVSGIFESGNTEFDQLHAIVSINDLQGMLGITNKITEFGVIVKDPKNIEDYGGELTAIIGKDFNVLTYDELLPFIMSYLELYDQVKWVIYLIIAVAVFFGIVNTMLMSVFERIQEFGVLMSIGMKKKKVFYMVIYEALILGVIGTIVGFIFGLLIYYPFSIYGIDLSLYSESLNSFGLGSKIFPTINLEIILSSMIVMPFTAIMGAIYPALKATRLQPTDAMRYV